MEIKSRWVDESKINKDQYDSIYEDSIKNNDDFWKKNADRIDWIKKFSKVQES